MRRLLFSISFAALMGVSLCAVAIAQEATPKMVSGGVLNGKAKSLPLPKYPDAAKASNASGAVAVNVVIDENGNVIFAEADMNDQRQVHDASGTRVEAQPVDPSLREAAEAAAREAKFAPTFLSGQPVQIKGKIMYVFAAEGGVSAGAAKTAGLDIRGASGHGVETAVLRKQDATGSSAKTVSGGVLNGKAVSLPHPEYPAAAKAVKAEGTVSVQVLLGEDGSVVSASAVSGHPLLRGAAEAAARAAKFSPTSLNGEAIQVSGVVTYNFVLAKKEDQ